MVHVVLINYSKRPASLSLHSRWKNFVSFRGMAVADAASVRTVAVQLRALSSDEENQPIIARDEGCMRALCGFIVGEDIAVAAIAVAAIKNLASHPNNYHLLRSEEELVEGLKDLLLADDAERSLRQEIFDVLEELTDENDDAELDELEELETNSGLKDKSKASGLDGDPNLLSEPVTARLHIPGISEEVLCARVEQLIIRKRGVISVAFEIGAEVAVVYTKCPVDQLTSFLATMTGSNIDVLPESAEDGQDEDGEEDIAVNAEKEPTQPGYLDETGQRLRDVARRNVKKKHTITQGASSLHERLKAQREEESRRKARSNRLFDSIGRGMRSGWGMW